MTVPSLDRGQNFGAITATVSSGDLCINAADHAPGMVVPRHEHENAYLCIVMAGCLEVRARSRCNARPARSSRIQRATRIPTVSATSRGGASISTWDPPGSTSRTFATGLPIAGNCASPRGPARCGRSPASWMRMTKPRRSRRHRRRSSCWPMSCARARPRLVPPGLRASSRSSKPISRMRRVSVDWLRKSARIPRTSPDRSGARTAKRSAPTFDAVVWRKQIVR